MYGVYPAGEARCLWTKNSELSLAGWGFYFGLDFGSRFQFYVSRCIFHSHILYPPVSDCFAICDMKNLHPDVVSYQPRVFSSLLCTLFCRAHFIAIIRYMTCAFWVILLLFLLLVHMPYLNTTPSVYKEQGRRMCPVFHQGLILVGRWGLREIQGYDFECDEGLAIAPGPSHYPSSLS